MNTTWKYVQISILSNVPSFNVYSAHTVYYNLTQLKIAESINIKHGIVAFHIIRHFIDNLIESPNRSARSPSLS